MNPQPPVGVITIGTGAGESKGTINVSDKGNDFGAALMEAAGLSKFVMVLPGAYTQSTVPTLATDDFQLMGVGNPTITTTVATTTRLATITGSRVKISGFHFTSATAVASSNWFAITGDEVSIDDNYWTCSASGSNSTPSFYAKFGTTSQGVKAPRFTRNRAHSALGLGAVHIAGDPGAGATSGTGAMISDNHFGTEANTPEKGYVSIRLESAGECVIDGNRAHGIGDGSDGAFAFIYATTSTTQSEAHHMTVTGNNIELFTSDHIIRGDGIRFCTIVGNVIGRCGGNGASEGTFHFTDNTGGTPVAGGMIRVAHNDLHNASATAGRLLWAEDIDGLAFEQNNISLINGTVGTINTTALNVTIRNNKYKLASGAVGLWQVGGTYTGLVIDEPIIPSGETLFSGAAPTAGAKVNGIYYGVTTPFEGQRGFRSTQTSGAAIGADITVTGIAATDCIVGVFNLTDGTTLDPLDFDAEAGDVQNNSATDLSGKTLIVSWLDV